MEEIFDRKLTIKDIQKINEMKPKFISIRSTKYLERKVLRELDASIKIRIIGEDENKSATEKEVGKYDVSLANQVTENDISKKSTLKAIYTAIPDSKGLARNFRELMSRIGIPCRYVENIERTHAWNEVRIDGTY